MSYYQEHLLQVVILWYVCHNGELHSTRLTHNLNISEAAGCKFIVNDIESTVTMDYCQTGNYILLV